MIDATKLPRPDRAPTSPVLGGSDVQRPTTAPAKSDTAGDKVDQVATYPAKSLVLEGGRYYTADTKK